MRLFSERKFPYKIFLFSMLWLSLLLWHSSCCCLYFNFKIGLIYISTGSTVFLCLISRMLWSFLSFGDSNKFCFHSFLVAYWSSNRFVEILSKIKKEFYETFVRVEYSFSRCNIIFEKWRKTVEMHSFFFETFFK